jgi:oligoendopeptidase F
LPTLKRFAGHLADGPATLANAFEAAEALLRRMGKVWVYAGMSQAVDTNDPAAVRMSGQAGALFAQVQASLAFMDPELLAIGEPTLRDWIAAEPRLAHLAHYADNLFRKQAHIRSAEVEELLGMLADPLSSVANTMSMLTDADFKFKPAVGSDGVESELTQGTLMKILASPDREARRTAWENYHDVYLAHKNALASNLATSIKANVLKMRARRHSSTLEASLFENNVPVEVFHNLIATFRANLPTWHRYFAVRRAALGVETLQPYDMWAPLRQAPHSPSLRSGQALRSGTSQGRLLAPAQTRRAPADPTNLPPIPYEQAVEWICTGLAPMGEEYVRTVRRGCLEDRWVDVYPCTGKQAGAFSGGWPGTYPFIMMSYNDNVFSLSTLAHELGHSMHSYFTWQNQPLVYCDYSTFVAEVASNFHQAMVRAHLLEHNPDPAFQVSLIEEAMANFFRYFFIMPTLARFELAIHEREERGEGLTADDMIALMADLFGEGFGDQVHVDRERVGIIWATFGHFYADYYVFQYATGISGAHALAGRILRGEPGAVDDYLGFLKAGSSLYPLDLLRQAGVDLTTPAPVEATFEVMAGLVERLGGLVGY